ncbi:MAG: hypothetical protein HKN82_10965 [Akkermansiaceae bacterium]|nr:hypothetical protein [Akkermansiaceae bacterium]NNM29853.1 hypothetical protein [Akkermansiaceae bacterium]
MTSSSAELDSLLQHYASQPDLRAGIDLEADNLHRYAEQLCLIQLTDGDRFDLVDPLAVEDLSAFGRFVEHATIWMHGADFDMTLLRREFGVLPAMVLDTQIAARLLGVRQFSYANLVNQFFDVELPKGSQKANWGQRPLPEKMLAYAVNDVRYLLPLAAKLEDALREKNRYDWFIESCRAAMARIEARDGVREDPWRIQGAGKLDRKGLCYLFHLWTWRDREAAEWDRPPFMVARNKDLITWCRELAAGRTPQLTRNIRGSRLERFRAAVEAAAQTPAEQWPKRRKGGGRRWESEQEARYDELAKARDAAAEDLDLDPAVLAPRAVLESLVWEDAPNEDLLLPWQRELLGL